MEKLLHELKTKENEIKSNLHTLYREKSDCKKRQLEFEGMKNEETEKNLQGSLSRYNEVMKEFINISDKFKEESSELKKSIQKAEDTLKDFEKAKKLLCRVYDVCLDCEGKRVLYKKQISGNDPYERKTSVSCPTCKGTGKYVN